MYIHAYMWLGDIDSRHSLALKPSLNVINIKDQNVHFMSTHLTARICAVFKSHRLLNLSSSKDGMTGRAEQWSGTVLALGKCYLLNTEISWLFLHCLKHLFSGTKLGMIILIGCNCAVQDGSSGNAHASYFVVLSYVYRYIFAVGTSLLEALKYRCQNYWRKEMWRSINTLWL